MPSELDMGQRFVSGRVKAIHDNSVDFEMSLPRLAVSSARVYREHWPQGIEFHLEQTIPLFLYNLPQHDDIKHWFASLKWAEESANPWLEDHAAHPRLDQEVSGEVTSIVNHEFAIVKLADSGIDAWLHKDSIPDGRFRALHEILPLGLRVKAKIIAVESGICRIRLSVLAWIKDCEYRALHTPEPGVPCERTPYLRYIETPTLASKTEITPVDATASTASIATLEEKKATDRQTMWQSCRILVIDDDKAFATNLCNWLQTAGAQTWAANNLQHAMQIINKHHNHITHILLDYNMDNKNETAALFKMIRRQKNARTCFITGSPLIDVAHFAKRIGMAVLPKPVAFDTLERWLSDGTLPQPHSNEPEAHWQREEIKASAEMFNVEAQLWLKQVCQQVDSDRALWLRCHHPGYELIQGYPVLAINNGNWLQMLNQSIVADVETSREVQIRSRPEAGRLADYLWPPISDHVIAIPRPHHEDSDILLLFGRHGLRQASSSLAWHTLQAWWQTLAQLYDLSTLLDEDQVFAIQGRVHGATLHELRPLMQPFTGKARWDAATAQEWWPQGQRAARLIEGGLYHFKPAQHQINLRERLINVFDECLWHLIHRRAIQVHVFLPIQDLQVTFPMDVFEHCLINLVDNATKFCNRRRWAHVEVRVTLEYSSNLPLVLSVSDQGMGMTPEQQRYLFLPRKSSSGGFGMGLYVIHSIVKAAGGELQCTENFRWGGCKFVCRLPLSLGI
jgi:CheY-like chemotaxis protein/predicted RNA-binding protein with RPS1 domain